MGRMRTTVVGVAVTAGLVAGLWQATLADTKSDAAEAQLSRGILLAVEAASEGNVQKAGLQAFDSTIDYVLAGIGDELPEWAQRFELQWKWQENRKPEWSILTVQPLFESEDLRDTIFTQASYRRYDMFGSMRDVANIGLGYRRLLLNNTVLVGVNGFFDYEFDNHHQRTSVGVEAKWAGLDFSANKYWGISSPHSAGAGFEEEVLDGQDIELTAQVPYLPWARVRARRYWWDTVKAAEDIKGWAASAELDLIQNLQVEAGVKSDNFMTDADEKEAFVEVRFVMNFGRPVAMSSEFVSDSPWLMRDMTEYRLDKVRRENKIVLERRSSGVIIARGS